MNPMLIPELGELILERNVQGLRSFIERLHPALVADLIQGLDPEELLWTLEILDDDKEALIFEYLPAELQYTLATGVGRPQLAKLVSSLSSDDRASFVRKLPQKVVDEILPLMAQAERYDVRRLLTFDEGTAGFRMTTEYAAVPANLSCDEALKKIRNEAPNKETIYNIYIIDEKRHLEGVIGLKDLLLERPDTPLSRIITKEIVGIRATEPAARAAELIAKYDLLSLPVLDDAGCLLGIVTVDDLIDVMEREVTQDILSLGGVDSSALDKPYFENSVSFVVRKRIGWLLLLFVAEMFTGTVLRHYDEELAKVVSLAFFIPLLIGTGGNAGSQTVSTIIRSLALKEITPNDWQKIVFKEGLAGLILGFLLGIVGCVRSLMWEPQDYQLALTVGVTIVAICTWANTVAAFIPLFAQRIGMDATVLSAPMITTLVDATGLLIYFTIAISFITKLRTPTVPPTAEFIAKVQALIPEAPPQFKDSLVGLIQDKTATSSHDWLFPLVAMVLFAVVIFWMSKPKFRHKHAANDDSASSSAT